MKSGQYPKMTSWEHHLCFQIARRLASAACVLAASSVTYLAKGSSYKRPTRPFPRPEQMDKMPAAPTLGRKNALTER